MHPDKMSDVDTSGIFFVYIHTENISYNEINKN